MMAWVAANGGVRAIGDAGATRIQTADWQECATSPTLARPAEETISGIVGGFEIPATEATLTELPDRQYTLD